jgi:energy-coupling factor transporter ATP-binding protein EcfA2
VPASLIARSLTVVRGPLVVLDDIDLTLGPGHRVGLVGPNGVGKSTLLGALAGRVDLDAGSVQVAPPTANVGLLPQEPERSATETVRGFLARRSGVAGRRPISTLPPQRWQRVTTDPTTDTPTRSTGGSPSAPPTSTPGSVRSGTNSASTSGCWTRRRSRCRGERRPDRRSPRCCCRDSTCSCSTSPPTISTSTASTDSNSGSSGSTRPCCW